MEDLIKRVEEANKKGLTSLKKELREIEKIYGTSVKHDILKTLTIALPKY